MNDEGRAGGEPGATPSATERRPTPTDGLERVLDRLAHAIEKPSWRLLIAVAIGPWLLVGTLVVYLVEHITSDIDEYRSMVTTMSQTRDETSGNVQTLTYHVRQMRLSGERFSQQLAEIRCREAGGDPDYGTGECVGADADYEPMRTLLFGDVAELPR